MSRTSPGRYALHEFAKNVFDVRITDEAGKPLAVSRPNPHEWDVTGHSGTVRVSYRVFVDDQGCWGTFRLSALEVTPPPNDDFADATGIGQINAIQIVCSK